MNKDVQIYMDSITMEEALEMADFLLNPISYQKKGQTVTLKESDKANFFYFLPVGSGRIVLMKKGEELSIKIDGKTVDSTTTNARDLIADAIVNNEGGGLYLYKNNMTTVRTFSNVRQNADGTYTAKIDTIPYGEFIRQHAYVANKVENGDFVPMNAYLEFMPGTVTKKEITKSTQENYKGVPIIEKAITSKTGEPGGAQYNSTNNTIYVNKPVLKSKFESKAWTTPRIQKDGSSANAFPEDMFKTYEEWESFVIEHEYQHSQLSRTEFDKSVSGTTTTADYENEINKRALESLGMKIPEVKPETKTQSASNTIKKNNLIDDSLLLRAGRKPSTAKSSQDVINAALPWYNSIRLADGRMLSDVVPISVMFDAVNTDPSVVAHWNLAGITLWQGADASDLYHEAWHAFSQIFLTAKQREDLYNAVGQMKGSFENYNGKTVEFKNATKLEKEEWLAEQFREHMLRGGKGKYSKSKGIIAEIFSKIFELLQYLFSNTTIRETQADYTANAKVAEMFEKLAVGKLGEPVFEPDAVFIETGLNKIKNRSLSDTAVIMKSMNGLMSESIDDLNDEYNTKGLTIGIISEASMRKAAYLKVQEKLVNHIESLKEKYEKAAEKRKIKIKSRIDLATWMLDNFGDPMNPKEGETILSYYEKNYIQSFEPDMADKDDNTTSRSEYADKSGNEVSINNMIDKKLSYTLSTLIAYNDNGEVEKNDLGFPKMVPARTAQNLLINITQGARNPKEIYDKLKEVEELFPIVKAFLKKVGNPDNIKGELENSMWGQINKLFTLPRINVVNLDIEQTKDSKGNISYITIRPGNASRESSKVFKLFNSRFTRSGETEPYRVKASDTGAVSINIEQLTSDLYMSTSVISKDPITFLKAIGLYMPELSVVKNALSSKENGNLYEINGLKNKVRAINAFNTWLKLNRPGAEPIKLTRVTDLLDKSFDKLVQDKSLREAFLKQESQYKESTFQPFTGFKTTLGNLYLQWTGDFSNSTITTTTGKTKYENSLPNTITRKTDSINNAINYEDLVRDNTENVNGMPIYIMNNLSLNRNPWMQNSMLMNILFDMSTPEKIKRQGVTATGKVLNARINILDMDGTKMRIGEQIDLVGLKSSDSDMTTKMLQDFYMMMIYGTSEATRHAGKSSTFLYQIIHADGSKHYVNPKMFASKDPTSSTGKSKVLAAYMGYLSSEVERIHKAKTDPDAKNIVLYEKKGKPVTLAEVGSKFIMFDDILTEDQKTEIYNLIDKGTITTAADFKNLLNTNEKFANTYQNQVNSYLENQYQQVIDKFKKEGIFDSRYLLSPNILKIVGDTKEYTREELSRQLIEAYTANQLLHNIETGLVYYGDPGIYNHSKEEYHKRNAGIGSTGETPRTDIHFQNYVNKPAKKGKYAESAWYTGPKTKADGTTVGQRDYNGTFNTAVLADVVSTSVYIDEYKKAAKDKERKRLAKTNASQDTINKAMQNIDNIFDDAYAGMKEGDAQGWISFDAYRLMMRGLDKWTTLHEKLYVRILNGDDVSAEDIANFFPIKKMQYWGTLATTGLPVEAFHKFSLMPLIPTVVKGTKLEQLHNKMVEQDIDYAVFASGSKLATVTNDGNFDKFYANKEGWLALNEPEFTFSKNVIYLDYLKDQVEVAPEFKEKIIFSTQLRKLVEEGSFENGVPVDFKPEITDLTERYDAWNAIKDESVKKSESKLYTKILRYESALKQLTEFKKKQLVEELGWTDKGPKDLTKFIDFIEKQLTRQEISDNELEFIDALKSAPMVNLDLSNFSSQIEKLLTAVVNKRLIRQKVTGEALIQASSAGFEKAGKFRNATEEERRKYSGTNDLKFYTPGNGMEVKISIQGHFKKLLSLPEVTRKAKAENISKLDALNSIIRDEKWLSKNRDMITMVGVRIPVQGLNSMEVMHVAEFLPEEAGNMIIPATEIVAKSGADFDIDKLSIQMPVLRWEGLKGNSKLTIANVRGEAALKELYQNLKSKAIEVEEFKVINSTVDELGNLVYDKDVVRRALTRDVSPTVKRFSTDIEQSNKLLNTILTAALGEEWFDMGYTESEIIEILKNYNLATSEEAFIKKMDNEAAYENQLLLATKDLILDPENFVSLITPNSTTIVKPISEKLRDKTRVYSSKKRFNGEPNGFSPTRIYEPLYNLAKLEYNSVGKQALGIGAVDNTFNVVFNRIGAYMSDVKVINEAGDLMRNVLLLPHNTMNVNGEQRISLSHSYDKNNFYKISDLFNQLINGWVDVEKDEWIFDLQGNKELTPVLLFLIQTGVPINQAVLFLSQPIIREYITDARSRKGTFSSVLGKESELNQHNTDARDSILFGENSKYGFGLNEESFYPDNSKNYRYNAINGKVRVAKNKLYDYFRIALTNLDENYFNEKALEDNLDNLNDDKTKDVYTDFDRNVFLHFMEILEMSKGLTEIKQATKFDTTRSSSLHDARVQLRKDIKASQFKGLDPDVYESIIKNSPIGSFKIQEFMIGLYEPFFPLSNSTSINSYFAKPNIESYISGMRMGETRVNVTFDKASVIDNFKKQLSPYIFYNWYFTLPSNKHYRSYVLNSELDVATVPYARRAAIYKDGKIYVDQNSIAENLYNKFYSNELQYLDADVAPLPANVFTGVNEADMYKKYLYERESLRALPNYKYSVVALSAEYMKIEKELSEKYLDKTLLRKGESTTINKETVKLWAYETYLRNHALNNINLPYWIFTGNNSYAYQYDQIVSNPAFKKITEYYDLLSALEVDVFSSMASSYSSYVKANVNTLRFRDTLLEIDQKNLYSENLNELKNPSILQDKFGISAIDAENISKFFNRFDVVAYLQSGSNPNSTFSILSIADSKVISELLAEPVSKFIDTVTQLEAVPNSNNKLTELLFDQYRKIFIGTNSQAKSNIAKRFRTFYDPNFANVVLSSKKDAVIKEFVDILEKTGYKFETEEESIFELFEETPTSFEDDYKYFGAMYKIKVENGVGVDVLNYKGKKSAKEKLLAAYNNNPNIDPQNKQPFRQPKSSQISPNQSQPANTMTFSDGVTISTPFKLNDQQTEALLELEKFYKNPAAYDNQITLKGYAGTGKTSIMKIFDAYLQRVSLDSIIYTSPTNRANAVTKLKNPDVRVYTLHSLFGLNPDFNFEEEYDLAKLNFAKQNKGVLKPDESTVLILDEASMVADGLFAFIQEEKKKNSNLKIIYMGDPAQLRPVGQDNLSKVFDKGTQLQLTKVERTGDNPILEESTNLRNGKELNYKTKVVNGIGVVYGDNNTFVNEAVKENFLSPEFAKNKLYFRILSATNAVVTAKNKEVRKLLFGDAAQQQLVVGDLIMGRSNFDKNYRTGQYKIMNSGDYEVLDIKPSTVTLDLLGDKVEFKGYKVTIQNLLGKADEKPEVIFVADVNDDDSKLIRLSKTIKDLREAGARLKKDGDIRAAASYFQKASDYENAITSMKPVIQNGKTLFNQTFDYGYAHTIHKSQGGTYTKVLILDDTINSFKDKNVQQELKYVAVSRATDMVYIATSQKLGTPEIVGEEPAQEPVSNEFIVADSLPAIEQNFADGSKYKEGDVWKTRTMQPQFKDKSTMDLIISGDRTRTTRAKTDVSRMMKDYNLSKIEDLVGKVIRMTDNTGRQVYTRITKVSPFTQEYQDATWQKEGWVKSVTDRHVGNYPYAIEFEVVQPSQSQAPVSTGDKFTKKNIFTVKPIQAADKKAVIKASIATQYIGFGEGIKGSSTDLYREQAGNFANTGNYSVNDVIFVSIGGKRGTEEQQKTQQDRTIAEAIKAVEAGATILTDNKAYTDASDYNTGEKRLYDAMKQAGYNYSEITVDGQVIGTWSKPTQISVSTNQQIVSKSTITQPTQASNPNGFMVGLQNGTGIPVYDFTLTPDNLKPVDIQKIKEANPNVIFVTDTVMAKPGRTANTTDLNKTSAVLAGLGPDNYFGIPTKFLAIPVDPKTGKPKGTLNKTTNTITPSGLLVEETEEEYNYNIQQIDAAIQALVEKMKLNPDKVLRFNFRGMGQSMINRWEENGMVIGSVEENVPANPQSAPKTFVYLSERLYDAFGYINPNSLPRVFAKGSVEMSEKVQRDQVVSDTEVTNDILNDILSCSI
jgi:exodeoxyribonuclease-5